MNLVTIVSSSAKRVLICHFRLTLIIQSHTNLPPYFSKFSFIFTLFLANATYFDYLCNRKTDLLDGNENQN